MHYTAALDYRVDGSLADAFARAIRRYWPGCRSERLQPGYTGVRAKLSGPGEAAADFLIHGPDSHGVPGLISMFGIESPGLTACLALAEEVATSLDKL